jgi:hypothetical protein
VVLEAALQPAADELGAGGAGSAETGAGGAAAGDAGRWAAEARSYFGPSGKAGAPAGLVAAGRAAATLFAADARGVRASQSISADEALDAAAEEVWELVSIYAMC